MVGQGDGIDGIYQALTVADIQARPRRVPPRLRPDRAAATASSAWKSRPCLAHDTAGTIAEAKKLWGLLDRPNAMIKVPGTPEGLPAIEELLYSRHQRQRHPPLQRRGVRGRRRDLHQGPHPADGRGLPVDRIASVASFFVSRIDAEVDKRIEAKIKDETDPAKKAKLEGPPGQGRDRQRQERLRRLPEDSSTAPSSPRSRPRGPHVQRVLWASVGTKNKATPTPSTPPA